MEFSRRPRRRARENIVPLVNIVFLLLIFFMLAGTLRSPEALEVDPPETAAGLPPASAGSDTRTLILDRHGVVALDGRILESGELRSMLSSSAEHDSPRAPIRLRADRRARAEDLLRLLESLSQLGFEDVALVTRDAS